MEIGNHKQASAIYEKYRDGEFDYHGGPFDRGSADSYYRRPRLPHKWTEGTYCGKMITDLTPEELEAYEAGYAWNEWQGDHKDWGEEDVGDTIDDNDTYYD